MVGGEPAADLGQHDAVGVAGARLDRRGVVPAFDRLRPARGGAGDGDGPLPVSRCRWWTGVSERGQSPVNTMQVAAVEMPFDRRVGAQPLQRRGGELVQHRAAVEQQQRADHRLQIRGTISPSAEHRANGLDCLLDGISTEHSLRQRLPRERPDLIECGEPGEQIGVGEEIGACLHADLPRETLPQLLWAQQLGPLLCRPGPEVAPQLTAAVQDDRGGVAGEPALEHGVGMPVQHGQRLVQWCGQSQNRLPLPVFAVPVEPQQVETESLQRIALVLRQPFLATETIQPQRPLPSRFRCLPIHDRRRRPVSCSPRRVSISTRQAWMWSMPRASLSASSRPDR